MKTNRNAPLLHVNNGGEFVYDGLNRHLSGKYRTDSPLFDNPIFPFCCCWCVAPQTPRYSSVCCSLSLSTVPSFWPSRQLP